MPWEKGRFEVQPLGPKNGLISSSQSPTRSSVRTHYETVLVHEEDIEGGWNLLAKPTYNLFHLKYLILSNQTTDF